MCAGVCTSMATGTEQLLRAAAGAGLDVRRGKKEKHLQRLDCLQQTPGCSLPAPRTDDTSTATSSRTDLTRGAEQPDACARDSVSFPKG